MKRGGRTALVAALAVGAVGVVLWLAVRDRGGAVTDVDRRAAGYVEELGPRPLASLSVEEKLLLFHSYGILDRRRAALEVWDALGADLADLAPERWAVFQQMAARLRRGERLQ